MFDTGSSRPVALKVTVRPASRQQLPSSKPHTNRNAVTGPVFPQGDFPWPNTHVLEQIPARASPSASVEGRIPLPTPLNGPDRKGVVQGDLLEEVKPPRRAAVPGLHIDL